jgi:hypothetical protein
MVTQQDCIDACMECSKVCDMCSAACLAEKDLGELRRCLKMTLDCAEICAAAARVMARDSDNQADILRACGDICERCAHECRKYPEHDHCRICADVCAHCVDLCHVMSGAAMMA